jgi:hypothetical protein
LVYPYRVVKIIDDGHPHLVRVWDGSTTSINGGDAAASLQSWAATVAEALKVAMGGTSQVGTTEVVSSISGHLTNGGVGCYGTLPQIVNALCVALYGDFDESLEAPILERLKKIDGVFHSILPLPYA